MKHYLSFFVVLLAVAALVAPRTATATSIIIDDPMATKTGTWISSASTPGYYGTGYLHNNQTNVSSATYTPNLPTGGVWDVWASWTSEANRRTSVPYTINDLSGPNVVNVNQQLNNGWNLLGSYNFSTGTAGNVVLNATSGTGYVIADAVAFSNSPSPQSLYIDPSGFTATASSTISTGGRQPIKAINGAGMVDLPFLTYHQGPDNGENVNWLSAQNDTAGWFKVDLGTSYDLDYMDVWNFTASNNNTRGVQLADIYVSNLANPDPTDFAGSGDWTLVGDDITFANAGATGVNENFDMFDFGAAGVTARWVAIDILSNYGDAYVGLGEVRFFEAAAVAIVPEPATVALVALGFAVALGVRRRKPRIAQM